MATQLENSSFECSRFQHQLTHIYRSVLKDFRRIVQSLAGLHVFFLSLIAIELVGFLPFIFNLMIAAFALGALFLTGFSYCVLYFYYQTKKPEQLLQLKEQFLQSCRQSISVPIGAAEHHLSIAEALMKLASYLHDFESCFYQLPEFLHFLSPILKRFSSYCFREDVFKMKRLLITASIEEHLKQVRLTPTDLEVHASLASAYVSLSKLYRELSCMENGKTQNFYAKNFRSAAQLAIEELRILNHYAPNDPWIYEQMAMNYGELDMPEEERVQLESLLKLRPQDRDALFRLGTIYFQLGLNARGLQIYEELMKSNYKKAEDLIASYGRSSSS